MHDPQLMDSLVLIAPGQLRLERRPIPEPGPGEVRIRVTHAGICGSDLHYFRDGGYGQVRMSAPMVLGHEIAGRVDRFGPGADGSGLDIGDAVAIDPSDPCGVCRACRTGRTRFCEDMRFMGSALRDPPVEGGFSQFVVCAVGRAVPLTGGDGAGAGALSEPLAVALHAVRRLGQPAAGRRLLITGFGPIGALALLAARNAGYHDISVADVADAPLALAARLGARRVIDLRQDRPPPRSHAAGLECAGHAAALQTMVASLSCGGHMVQVGLMPADVPLPVNDITLRELRMEGSFRFDSEFRVAARLISEGVIDIAAVVTETFPYRDAASAMKAAQNRERSIKVLLTF